MGVSNSAVELTLMFRLQSGCELIRGSGKYSYVLFRSLPLGADFSQL